MLSCVMLTLISWLLLLHCSGTLSSLYDPHKFPEKGPFFEGWYVRIQDPTEERAFAVLFGKVLPKVKTVASRPDFVGLIKSTSEEVRVFNGFPDASAVNFSVNGNAVTTNPKVKTPANFTYSAMPYGVFDCKPTSASVRFTIEDNSFTAEIGAPVPWDGSGLGPEGWLARLPLPLHWFVYSTYSHVTYRWTNHKTGEQMIGTGVAHMEKNWGRSFPEGWLWTQGTKMPNKIHFALGTGPINFGSFPWPISGHLAGYRNPEKTLYLTFRPDNSIITVVKDSCNGSTRFTIKSFRYRIHLHITAPTNTFSDCLYGPMKNGFEKVCSESFHASAEVMVYKRTYFVYRLVDHQFITGVALEFGGEYTCPGRRCGKE